MVFEYDLCLCPAVCVLSSGILKGNIGVSVFFQLEESARGCCAYADIISRA